MNKSLLVILGVIVLLGIIFQGWVYYSNMVEQQQYTVLKTFDEIEIRHYPPARMISYEKSLSSSGKNSGSFQVLAGYIFGGNEAEEKFAMTAPVHMENNDSSSKMSFMLPKEAWDKDMPKPNNDEVEIHWTEEQTVAAIRFSGYLNKETYEKNKAKLEETLAKNSIEHKGDYRTLGYDPPYKLTDRRNEIIVRVEY